MSNVFDDEQLQSIYNEAVDGDDLTMFDGLRAVVKAATSSSDARYQARVRELEEALREVKRDYEFMGVSNAALAVVIKALSTTTPDTAYQKALLEARIGQMEIVVSQCQFDPLDSLVMGELYEELRAQLASLNRNETLGE